MEFALATADQVASQDTRRVHASSDSEDGDVRTPPACGCLMLPMPLQRLSKSRAHSQRAVALGRVRDAALDRGVVMCMSSVHSRRASSAARPCVRARADDRPCTGSHAALVHQLQARIQVHPSRYMPGCSPTSAVRADPRRRMLEHLAGARQHRALLDELDDMIGAERRAGVRAAERRVVMDDGDAERLYRGDGFAPFPARSPTPPHHVSRARDTEGPSAAWQAWRNQIDLLSLDPTPAEAARAFERQYRRQNAVTERAAVSVRASDSADTSNALPPAGAPRRASPQQLSTLGQVYQLAGTEAPPAGTARPVTSRGVQAARTARSPFARGDGVSGSSPSSHLTAAGVQARGAAQRHATHMRASRSDPVVTHGFTPPFDPLEFTCRALAAAAAHGRPSSPWHVQRIASRRAMACRHGPEPPAAATRALCA